MKEMKKVKAKEKKAVAVAIADPTSEFQHQPSNFKHSQNL